MIFLEPVVRVTLQNRLTEALAKLETPQFVEIWNGWFPADPIYQDKNQELFWMIEQ